MKKTISKIVGIPAVIGMFLFAGSEIVIVPLLCAVIAMGTLAWNGYFKGLWSELW